MHHAAFAPARVLRFSFFTAARFTAQRRFIASASRLRPSGVKVRFRYAGFAELAAGATSAAIFAAQRFFCPSDRRFGVAFGGRPLRFATTSGGASTLPTSSNAASARSMADFYRSSSAMMPLNASVIR